MVMNFPAEPPRNDGPLDFIGAERLSGELHCQGLSGRSIFILKSTAGAE
jgi:hypothetical protein